MTKNLTVNTTWAEQAHFNNDQICALFTEAEMAQALEQDSSSMLEILASMEASIVFRAVRICSIFFEFEKENRKDKEHFQASFIRPRLRFDTRSNTLEMTWVRRVATQEVQTEATGKNRYGKTYVIKTDKGLINLRVRYEHIKKGKTDRYPESTFKNQPEWVQIACSKIESIFCLLRKEQDNIQKIKHAVFKIHAIQSKQLSEKTLEKLREKGWEQFNDKYQVNIDLSQKDD